MRGMSVIIAMSLIILLCFVCSPVMADIYINTPDYSVDFYGSPTSGTAPLTVTFVGHAYEWRTCDWWFGDGGASHDRSSVTHTYTSAGTYTVTWNLYGGSSAGTIIKTNYITVSSAVVTRVATPTPTPTTIPTTVLTTSLTTAPSHDYDARIAVLETQLAEQNQKLVEHGNALEKITNFLRIFFGWK